MGSPMEKYKYPGRCNWNHIREEYSGFAIRNVRIRMPGTTFFVQPVPKIISRTYTNICTRHDAPYHVKKNCHPGQK